MNKREELKRIIDSLTDEQLPKPIELLKFLIPEEDEELTEEEWKAIKEGRKQIENGEYIALDELLKNGDG